MLHKHLSCNKDVTQHSQNAINSGCRTLHSRVPVLGIVRIRSEHCAPCLSGIKRWMGKSAARDDEDRLDIIFTRAHGNARELLARVTCASQEPLCSSNRSRCSRLCSNWVDQNAFCHSKSEGRVHLDGAQQQAAQRGLYVLLTGLFGGSSLL